MLPTGSLKSDAECRHSPSQRKRRRGLRVGRSKVSVSQVPIGEAGTPSRSARPEKSDAKADPNHQSLCAKPLRSQSLPLYRAAIILRIWQRLKQSWAACGKASSVHDHFLARWHHRRRMVRSRCRTSATSRMQALVSKIISRLVMGSSRLPHAALRGMEVATPFA